VIDAAGQVSLSAVVVTADAPLELVDVKPMNSGYVGLFQQVSLRRAFLLHWDGAGQVDAEARGFRDVLQTFGLAQSGDFFGLAFQRSDETSAIVLLDSTGAPTSGAPTCLDSALPGGEVALAGGTDGFAALVRYGNGSEWLFNVPTQ
jgi:hypothetical protein